VLLYGIDKRQKSYRSHDDFEKNYSTIKQFIDNNKNETIMFISSSEKTTVVSKVLPSHQVVKSMPSFKAHFCSLQQLLVKLQEYIEFLS
jgi:hypothetical protein